MPRLAVLLVWAVSAPAARAHDRGSTVSTAPDAQARQVVLELRDTSARFAGRLEDTLRELLDRVDLQLVRADRARQGRVVAHVRVETHQQGASVVISDERGRMALVQREVPPASTHALLRETLAHIILSAVEALALQGPVAASPNSSSSRMEPAVAGSTTSPQPSAPAPAVDAAAHVAAPSGSASTSVVPRPASEREGPAAGSPMQAAHRATTPQAAPDVGRSLGPATWGLALGAHAGGVVLGSGHVSARFDGAAALTFSRRFAPTIVFLAGSTLPVHLAQSRVRADLRLAPVRAQARLEPYRRPRWALRVALGAGLDVVSMRPTSAPPDLQLSPSTRRLHPVFGASLGARIRMPENCALTATLGIDVDGGPAAWQILRQDSQGAFFETARVRPYLSLGFEWTWLPAL